MMGNTVDSAHMRLEFRHQIDQALLAGRPPEEIAQLTITQLAAIMSCAWACALLVDLELGEARVLATSQAQPTLVHRGTAAPLAAFGIAAEGLTDDAANIGLSLDPEVAAYGAPVGWSLIRIPLVASNQPIGVLDVAVIVDQQPLLGELMNIRAMADQLALAIQIVRLLDQAMRARDTARVLAGRLVEVTETERRTIASELHDQVGQELTALLMLLERAASAGADRLQRDPPLIEARAIVQLLISRTRDLALDLHPALLDSLGLLPALLAQQDRFTKQTGVSVMFEHRGIVRRFPRSVETAAYRIVQEALTNIARYAQVQTATVRLWADSVHLFVQIQDLGQGFDAAIEHHGFGLTTMRERATLIGGGFELESRSGQGTRITAMIPVEQP